MATTEDLRDRMIQHLARCPAGEKIDVCLTLWRGLGMQFNLIIGQGGFDALYKRSVHLARQNYPWLAPAAGEDFEELRQSLLQQDAQLAGEACGALLIIFTDTLILLIGELLTTSILQVAWSDDVLNTAGKEPQP